MKKSLNRIINLVDEFNFGNIYLISENHMCNVMYIKHIKQHIDIDKYKIIELNSKTFKRVKMGENNLIILCGRWYLNRIARENGFNRFIGEHFKISVPFDEIERDKDIC